MSEKENKVTIKISQNGWEYTGYCEVYADSVVKVDDVEAVVTKDGVDIHLVFDEEIKVMNHE